MNGDGVSFLVAAVILLGALAFNYLRRKQTYWQRLGIPSGQGSRFLVGNAAGLGNTKQSSDILDPLYYEFKRQGLKCGGIVFFIEPEILVVDPDLVKTILVKDFNKFHDRGVYVNPEGDPLSGGLFALSGNDWRMMRQKLTPVFTSGKLKLMFSTMVNVADRMRVFLQNSKTLAEIEIRDLTSRYTVDVIGNVVFGIECNSLKNTDSDFSVMGKKALQFDTMQMIKFFIGGHLNSFAKTISMRMFPMDVSNFFMNLTRESVDFRKTTNLTSNDILTQFMQIKGKTNNGTTADCVVGGMTLNELAAQSFQFFTAGFETSSATMTFCIYELALNIDIQDRLREEIKSVYAEGKQKLSYESIQSMQYLNKVVDETLRKYPPVDNLIRISNCPFQIPETDFLVPANTLFRIPVFSIQRDPDHYPDPERFDTDRFESEKVGSRNPYLFLPFGEGPRNCIGLRFGLLQTKVGLVTLLQHFRFSAEARTPMKMEFDPKGILLRPKSALYLKIEPIN
ncbi:probable cytochrome P450 6a13 [Uranotaenia lowii]|uniref:probable cytochrome P450 6a13 n=1 Tax=Uranotaenia lowii TaxID=190385 RepID=UPI0024783A39|nr:probable cytochrome P450 6a13 [Uranotaenia lowii]